MRVRLQKRNNATGENLSKEDYNGSLDNLMEPVVAIQAGEFSLKGGTASNQYSAARNMAASKRNTTEV